MSVSRYDRVIVAQGVPERLAILLWFKAHMNRHAEIILKKGRNVLSSKQQAFAKCDLCDTVNNNGPEVYVPIAIWYEFFLGSL
jgi:hypothetical protein